MYMQYVGLQRVSYRNASPGVGHVSDHVGVQTSSRGKPFCVIMQANAQPSARGVQGGVMVQRPGKHQGAIITVSMEVTLDPGEIWDIV
jgi:hypothetical protein